MERKRERERERWAVMQSWKNGMGTEKGRRPDDDE
jgi:hypothetical protein